MKTMLFAVVVALVAVGCSGKDSPTAPPPPPANITATGNLTTVGCFVSTVTTTLASCATFNGTAMNTGAGCATAVRGVITTFAVPGNTQIGSAAWTYTGPMVRVGESISFSGGPLTIGVPLLGGWVYQNSITFDSVRC